MTLKPAIVVALRRVARSSRARRPRRREAAAAAAACRSGPARRGRSSASRRRPPRRRPRPGGIAPAPSAGRDAAVVGVAVAEHDPRDPAELRGGARDRAGHRCTPASNSSTPPPGSDQVHVHGLARQPAADDPDAVGDRLGPGGDQAREARADAHAPRCGGHAQSLGLRTMPEANRKREVGRGERVLPGVWRLRLPLPWPGRPALQRLGGRGRRRLRARSTPACTSRARSPTSSARWTMCNLRLERRPAGRLHPRPLRPLRAGARRSSSAPAASCGCTPTTST